MAGSCLSMVTTCSQDFRQEHYADEFTRVRELFQDWVLRSMAVPSWVLLGVSGMTEAEWLANTDPAAMLHYLDRHWRLGEGQTYGERIGNATRLRPSDRKLRLFACACCRHHQYEEPYLPRDEVVALAELHADGASLGSLAERYNRLGPSARCEQWLFLPGLEAARNWAALVRECDEGAQAAALLRDIIGNPFRPVVESVADVVQSDSEFDRCIVWRPEWLTWNGGLIPRLARTIYDERAFDRMSILADALEEVGVPPNGDLVRHCRGEQRVKRCGACVDCCSRTPRRCATWSEDIDGFWGWARAEVQSRLPPVSHVRGCWVVDTILGRG